eukprot:3834625-Rhodomonas_salina.2
MVRWFKLQGQSARGHVDRETGEQRRVGGVSCVVERFNQTEPKLLNHAVTPTLSLCLAYSDRACGSHH